jgi:hypothetical protein
MPRSAHTVCLCVLCGSQNKQRLFPYTALTDYFLTETECVYCAVRTGSLNATFCPHSVFMCFVSISEQTAIISLYSINWLVFTTETECFYCAVRTKSFYTVQVNPNIKRVKRMNFILLSLCIFNIRTNSPNIALLLTTTTSRHMIRRPMSPPSGDTHCEQHCTSVWFITEVLR